MTKRQFYLGTFILFTLVCVSGIMAYVSIQRYKVQSEINAQTEVEKTKIEEQIKLERTKERMQAIPWYNKAEDK